MNKLKAAGFFLVALTAGLGAVLVAAGWGAQKNQGMTKIVLAATDIKKDSKVTSAMFSIASWPSASVPPGAIGSIAQIQGKPLKVALRRGEAVLESHFNPKTTHAVIDGAIAKGKRAMTVKVNEVAGVGGFALPGTHVDVIVNLQREQDRRSASAARMSRTVLEHVLVLAAAQEASREGSKPRPVTSVTLEVSLADAEKLDLARSIGTLSLVLRNPADGKVVNTAGVTRNELFGAAPIVQGEPVVRKPAAPARRAAPVTCVEVIRRGVRVDHCFPLQ